MQTKYIHLYSFVHKKPTNCGEIVQQCIRKIQKKSISRFCYAILDANLVLIAYVMRQLNQLLQFKFTESNLYQQMHQYVQQGNEERFFQQCISFICIFKLVIQLRILTNVKLQTLFEHAINIYTGKDAELFISLNPIVKTALSKILISVRPELHEIRSFLRIFQKSIQGVDGAPQLS